MTRLFIIVYSLAMALRCGAQLIGTSPDMYFTMDFAPLPDSPDNAALSGGAQYYRAKTFLLPNAPVFTNQLEFGMSMAAPPVESWILEKQPNGSFNPVVQVTNLVEDGGYYYLRPAPLTLTTNQIHSLLAGNWYAAVDFAESSYLGQLVPDDNFAFWVQGPTVKTVLPPGGFGGPYSYKILATNNRDARVVLDASPSTDPFYLPMQFTWPVWHGFRMDGTPAFTLSGVRATNSFEVGQYVIGLQVGDGIATNSSYSLPLEVTTAGLEINLMLSDLQYVSLPIQKRRVLVNTLSKAASKFDRGYTTPGCADLRSFKILLKTSKVDPETLDYYLTWTQFIIDAFNKPRR